MEEFDIAVVGAGAAGAVITAELSKYESLRIICLEQGDVVKSSDLPSYGNDWDLSKLTKFNSDPNVRKSEWDYPIDYQESAIQIANFNAIGGSTVLYSGHYPRMHQSDFEVFTRDGVASDWPISYLTISKYYEIMQEQVAVAGVDGDPVYPEIGELLPPVPIGKLGTKLAEGFNKLGWHWWPSYSAIATKEFNNQHKCSNLGLCNLGCPFSSKSSTDVTHVPLAKKNGVEFRTQVRVSRIMTNSLGKLEGLEYVDRENRENLIRSRIVILAASGVGTPRILLNSKTPKFPNGLGNNYDQVGRNLMLHPLGYVEGVFQENLQSSYGPQGCMIASHEFYDSPKNENFNRGLTIQALRGPGILEYARSQYQRNILVWGKNHHQTFKKSFDHTAHLSIIVEDLPEQHNRVIISNSNKDKFGIPNPIVQYKLSENSRKILSFGLNKAKQLLNEIGAQNIVAFGPVKNTGWHILGTARMGVSPINSVVGPNGEIHECNDVFVADGSLFVTSGSVNPAATIQALALYIADCVVDRLKEKGIIQK